jgi:hypothetical protein
LTPSILIYKTAAACNPGVVEEQIYMLTSMLNGDLLSKPQLLFLV